jgi:mono/diheme cytochrome c family protein
MRAFLVLIGTLAILVAIAAAVFFFGGFFNVAATSQDPAIVDWALIQVRKASIASHATGTPPMSLDDPATIQAGAKAYAARGCVHCHGAPGASWSKFSEGLNPSPPDLKYVAGNPPAHLFWVVKNGIKMTGMPAWSYRLRDEEIWDVVAFVRASVGMSPQQYAALAAGLPRHADAIFHPAPADATPTAALGDVEAGRRATERYLCVTCHVIPGLVGADRHVGPPLNGIARRGYIGGVVVNTPDNMVRWLKDPRALDPLSAMPALGLSDQDARDIAAFMYTLDGVAAE